MQANKHTLDADQTEIWFAGKLIPRKGKLSDRLGRNDKTYVVVRLQPSGEGPPAREPVTPDTRSCSETVLPYDPSKAHCQLLQPESIRCFFMAFTQHQGMNGAACNSLIRNQVQALDMATQQAMLSYYRKRQDEDQVGCPHPR